MKNTVIEVNKPDLIRFAKAIIDLHKKQTNTTSGEKSC
ncbi:hypothetical protein BJ795_3592 [Bacillus subtilis]|nr:hypothetical protein BJ795_3592 [Bacillus subtilis]